MNIYSQILKNIILPIGDLFFGGNYVNETKKWKKYDTLNETELANIQKELLDKILVETINNVPFYFKNKENILQKDGSISIKNFPILTKEILRKEQNELVSNIYKNQKLEKNHSSGSSGIQSFTFMTPKHKFYLRALQTHWFNWSGFEEGKPIVQLGMSPKRTLAKKLKDLFFRVTYLNSFFLSKQDLLDISKKMNDKKIPYLAGYPSEMNEIAEMVIANNLNYPIKGIVSFGDKLYDHYIKNFNTAFNNPIRIVDTYGCAEGILMACKKDLPYYYIMTPHVYIEIIDDFGKEVEDGEIGHVLVTCLTNYAMPLIRYKLGDLAIKLPKEKYPENREHAYPLLERIIGRDTDYVCTNEGIKIFVTTFVAIMEFYPEIKQFKIIQNSFETIDIEYTTDTNFEFNPSCLSNIKNEINKLTQNKLNIIFKEVDHISPSRSGKPQVIESNIIKK